MSRKHIFFLFLFVFSLIVSLCPASVKNLRDVRDWFILLAYEPQTTIDSDLIKKYDMAILDADAHPDLEELRDQMILIAYISVGEAEDYRFYWDNIKKHPMVIRRNPNWEGNYYVDVRHKDWQNLLLNEVIARIRKQGFKGLMLDTLDTAQFLELENPIKYAGSQKAMIELVKKIHKKYPDLFLISNNGFSLLDELGPFLSGALVEDIYMMPDFEAHGYKPVPEEDREYKVTVLKKVMERFGLPVFVIDYVPSHDEDRVKKCLVDLKALGFKPYIAEKNLSEIYNAGMVLNP